MKYPVIYVHQLMGVFKHGKIVETLSIEIQIDEAFLADDPALRKGYLAQLIQDAYHAIEGQQIVAQATQIKAGGKIYMLFKSNLDKRLLKAQLQQLVNELSEKVNGYEASLRYGLFQSLLKIKGKDLFLRAMQEGEPLEETSDGIKYQVLVPNKKRSATNYLTTLKQYQLLHEKR